MGDVSDLYDLLVNHFGELEPLDYVLIVLLVVGICWIVFRWLRGMWKEPLAAKTETVEAQKETIAAWKETAEAHRDLTRRLREETEALERELAETRELARAEGKQHLTSHQALLAATFFSNQFALVSSVKTSLLIYMGLRIERRTRAPDSYALYKRITEIEERVIASQKPLDQATMAAVLAERIELELNPGEIASMLDRQADADLLAIYEEMTPHVEAYFASQQPAIGASSAD